ncbi:MAG: helix-turn-helix transcriptional regulator [Anaerolineae bacterium]|nr:helix-turn-helix transcriptional regulator [Gemmatimonadaceae bacterium]
MSLSVRARPDSVHGRTVRIPGFTLTSGLHDPRATLPRHHHELPTLCYVMRGGFTEYSRGHATTCTPNTLKLTPAGDEHWNHFMSVQTHGLLVEVEPSRFEEIRSIADLLDDRVHLRGGAAAEVARRLVLELAEGDDAALVAAEGLLLELLASLARSDGSTGRGATPRWLTHAMDIVNERFTGQLSLSELSTLVGVHPVTLARWFRRSYGCTVGQRLRRLRIEKAARDLLDTDRPLGEIALNAGFADQSHFCNVFRREMCMTPGRYRASRG